MHKPKSNKINILLTGYLLYIISGGIFITSGYFNNAENDGKFYFVVVHSLILFICCLLCKNGIKALYLNVRSDRFCIGMTFVGLMSASYGLLQHIHYIPSRHSAFDITGSFENPAGFVISQSLFFPFGIYVFLKKYATICQKIIAFLPILYMALPIVLTLSRSGILIVCAVSMIMTVCNTNIVLTISKNKWLVFGILVLCSLCISMSYSIKANSTDGRLFIWKNCADMIKEQPIWGHGVNGFSSQYMCKQAAYFMQHPEDSANAMLADNIIHPFNEYIKLVVNYGFIGLFIALLILIVLLIGLRKNGGKYYSVGLSIFSIIFIQCQFSYPYHYAVVWLMTGVLIFLTIPLHLINKLEKARTFRYSIASLLLITLCINVFMMYLDLKWAEMAKRSMSGQTEQMLPHYKKIKPYMQFNPLFLYNYAAELNYARRYNESLLITEQCMQKLNNYNVQLLLADNQANIGQMNQAIKSYTTASTMIPCRFVPLDAMMDLYLQIGDTIEAQRIARKIISKPIKVPSYYVDTVIGKARHLLLVTSTEQPKQWKE